MKKLDVKYDELEKEKEELLKMLKEATNSKKAATADTSQDTSKLGSKESYFKLGDYSPLSQYEVDQLTSKFGRNVISTQKERPWYKVLYKTVLHPFNAVLAFLAIVAGATQDFVTMTVMFIIISISTGLRFVQEWKNEREANALKKLVQTTVTVYRKYEAPEDRDPSPDDVWKITHGVISEKEIPLTDVVPGDLVKLGVGDMIPADLRILESKDLFVSQAALTGESMPVEKFLPKTEKVLSANETKFDLPDRCFMGSSIISGVGVGMVIDTGPRTVFGELAKNLAKHATPSAFQIGIKRLSYMFIVIMVIMLPITFVLNGTLQKRDADGNSAIDGNNVWLDALLFSIAVAVGLTPGMLPLIVNGTLASGAVQMAKKKTIVKNLDAIVNFGAINILCTDKTGTLTQNKVVLIKYLGLDGESSSKTLEMAYLNSYYQTGLKNLLDKAVIEFCKENGSSTAEDAWEKIDEIPFDFSRKRLSVVVKNTKTKKILLVCKGALEEVLHCCSKVHGKNGFAAVTKKILEKCKNISSQLNDDGLRVVGVAYKILQEYHPDKLAEENLIFTGYLAFLDPPKESTEPAIKELMSRHIEVKVLTGDSPLVCNYVCKAIKLPIKGIISGGELEKITNEREKLQNKMKMYKTLMDLKAKKQKIEKGLKSSLIVKLFKKKKYLEKLEAVSKKVVEMEPKIEAFDEKETQKRLDEIEKEFGEIAQNNTIFAKLSPTQKTALVETLKNNGNVVGFLGDGINDAGALKKADIGISVDEAVDVAKESADVILLEKSLMVLAKGVVLGRKTYANTIKYLKMAISSNFGNVFSVLIASAWLGFLPMLPIHLVLQNLIYDFSQLAIPWDNVDEEYLMRPVRWNVKGIIRYMVCLGPFSSLFDIATFLYMVYYFQWNGNYVYYNFPLYEAVIPSATIDPEGQLATWTPDQGIQLFQSGWFVEGLLTQTLIVHMIRTEKIPFFQSRASWPLLVSTFLCMTVGVILPYIPLNQFYNMSPLPGMYYPFLVGDLIAYCVLSHLTKKLYIYFFHEWL